MFSRFDEEKCLSYVLAFVLLYWNNIELERIFELVDTFYPIKWKNNEPNLKRKILLLLVKWHRKGYLFCKDLKFCPKMKFFTSFVEEINSKGK